MKKRKTFNVWDYLIVGSGLCLALFIAINLFYEYPLPKPNIEISATPPKDINWLVSSPYDLNNQLKILSTQPPAPSTMILNYSLGKDYNVIINMDVCKMIGIEGTNLVITCKQIHYDLNKIEVKE